MRILGVRFKNLNSLVGEWQVDFTHPAYDGLFAITGPTGAGKTTILDAVCLGLYGRTPRLDKVTKSSNEVMSRQTGECFAEVTFETQKGRYRCHWSQHRARKRPGGELQQARHEIADAASGEVNTETTELSARRKDRAAALAVERGKRLTERSGEALREEMNAGEAELKQLRLDVGGIAKSLSDNELLRGKQRERMTKIDARKMELARWNALHELIGSADGKKFRNFAQGLTFEVMTVHANRRLEKMTDRYLLIRDLSQPLELNVIDNYQAGEIRSTKNLSGGESFIVSLALALGLSQMASRNVRIDSLFLDEGFGTLDEEALETALETLAGLRQDGKLIGVISHVAALKERIGTRIQVTPGTGGRSRITGPGCRGL